MERTNDSFKYLTADSFDAVGGIIVICMKVVLFII